MTGWYSYDLSYLLGYGAYRGNHFVWAETRGNPFHGVRVGEFATRGEAVALMVALILGEAVLKQVIENTVTFLAPVIPPGYGLNPPRWR